jgi:threonyl-tRNA synthetase
MKILQMDVEKIDSEFIKPEAALYEETKESRLTMKDALVLFVSVEKGDTEEMAERAIKDTWAFMEKLKRKTLIIYPFAHLSNDLASPKEALVITKRLYEFAAENKKYATYKTPFGWNKKLTLAVKGHPLAEQSRSYSGTETESKTYKKAKPEGFDTSIVRKSDFSGLPEADHRTIGERLDLFSFQEVSPAMVFWHKNGNTIFRELVSFMREQLYNYNYEETSTPVLNNLALWHVSGHIDHYKENMFCFNSESGDMGMKPMNCPSTILIYKSKKWSYRELPFRTATFDKLYRNELSGALTGLFRVRELTQDDGHIFLREDQIEDEIIQLIELVKKAYDTIGMKYEAKLSTMPDNHMGSEELWEKATEKLEKALKKNKVKYTINEKDGAFYGPKIDFDVIDSIGRKWQCATIQLDYQQPLRFNLEYTGDDGKQYPPVMVHRAIFGSLERFIGVLIEHYQGKFPTWLSPVQVAVMPLSQQHNEYANSIYKKLREGRMRVTIDESDRTLEYKIREAQSQKIPYMIIIGKKEVESGKISVRCRSGSQKHDVDVNSFISALKTEISDRAANLMY